MKVKELIKALSKFEKENGGNLEVVVNNEQNRLCCGQEICYCDNEDRISFVTKVSKVSTNYYMEHYVPSELKNQDVCLLEFIN